jgi:hypothetical protein
MAGAYTEASCERYSRLARLDVRQTAMTEDVLEARKQELDSTCWKSKWDRGL